MLPFSSTSGAPNDWKIAPAVSTLSSVTPRPMPNGLPALWQASAALSIASKVQASALGGPPAGYIPWMSMPACFFNRRRPDHGPLIGPPTQAGAAIHLLLARTRYSTVGLTLPLS